MIDRSYRFAPWFMENWSRVGLVVGVWLLALSPLPLTHGLTLALFLVYLQLPVYMLHQYEEHARGAFRAYINHELAGDRDALTNTAIVWINILGVWGVDLLALYLAIYVNPALGLIAAYMAVINGLLHVGMAAATRKYNPGLWTGLILFLPVGGYTLYTLARLPGATLGAHALGLGVAALIHILLIGAIRVRITLLKRATVSS